MPPIQVLPYVQSPLEQLMPYISQAAGELAQGLRQRYADKNDERLISAFMDPNISSLERLALYSKMSKPRQEAIAAGLRASVEGERFGYQKDREKRLRDEGILSTYDKRISQITSDLKDPELKRDERKKLQKLKEDLVKEQAVNRTLLRGGKEPKFKHLEMQPEGRDLIGSEPAPAQPAQPPTLSMQPQPSAPKSKQKWDPQDPHHIKRREALLQKAGGDRGKANQLLLEEFEP